jgi:uncharacterized DUF497 family protein
MFDWDEANIGHIAEHGVVPHEAEEAYDSNPLFLEYSVEDGEERYREIGETRTGRVLVVVSTMRGDLVRVVTAYSPDGPLRIIYLAFKESEQHGKEDHS